MRISQQYIEGVKEGREIFNCWKREGFLTRDWLMGNIVALERLRDKMAPLAGTAIEIKFLDGELDFFRNQLKKLA